MMVRPVAVFVISLAVCPALRASAGPCQLESNERKQEAAKDLVTEWGPKIVEHACSVAAEKGWAKMQGEAGVAVQIGRMAIGLVACYYTAEKTEAFFRPNLDCSDLCSESSIAQIRQQDFRFTPAVDSLTSGPETTDKLSFTHPGNERWRRLLNAPQSMDKPVYHLSMPPSPHSVHEPPR
jgi:hypothetical protein